MRLFVIAMMTAGVLCLAVPSHAQEDNPVIPFFNTLGGLIVKGIEERSSPDYPVSQLQPGGLTRGQVIVVQQKLIERGYDVGAPDGIVGPKTMAVVARLQQSAGTPVTGLPDAQLLQALLQ